MIRNFSLPTAEQIDTKFKKKVASSSSFKQEN